jgi:carbon-monoxide dehydrogenase iron sulfur subunit
MPNKTIIIRVERCLGCKSCEIACATAHSSSKELARAVQAGEKPGTRVMIEAYGQKPVPVHCNHCDDPACMLVCPTGAIQRSAEGEPVLIDGERCIGCKMCVQACPFGVITINPGGKGVLKCDLCVERLANGDQPACVAACPTRALVFTEERSAGGEKRKRTAAQIVEAAAQGQKEASKKGPQDT